MMLRLEELDISHAIEVKLQTRGVPGTQLNSENIEAQIP